MLLCVQHAVTASTLTNQNTCRWTERTEPGLARPGRPPAHYHAGTEEGGKVRRKMRTMRKNTAASEVAFCGNPLAVGDQRWRVVTEAREGESAEKRNRGGGV